jgi:hypothetical protein
MVPTGFKSAIESDGKIYIPKELYDSKEIFGFNCYISTSLPRIYITGIRRENVIQCTGTLYIEMKNNYIQMSEGFARGLKSLGITGYEFFYDDGWEVVMVGIKI